MVSSSLLLTAVYTGLASAACSRDILKSATDAFIAGALAAKPLPDGYKLSPGAKITENNKVLGSLTESAYGKISALSRPFQVSVRDVDTCNAIFLILPKQGPETAITSVRIKLSRDDVHNITEVEILNAKKGAHGIFKPEGFPSPEAPVWNAPQGGSLNHKSLVEIGNSYAEGIQTGVDSVVQAAAVCPRIENGQTMTQVCNKGLSAFMYPVLARRWYADTQSGNVMGSFFFDYRNGKGKMNQMGIRSKNSKDGLWLHEYFKVQGGKINNVVAAMQLLPADYKDTWAA